MAKIPIYNDPDGEREIPNVEDCAKTFLELLDTPSDYTGMGGFLIAVAMDENGLVFKAQTGASGDQSDWNELDPASPAYIWNKPVNLSDFNDDVVAGNYAPIVHTHVEADITDLDKYTKQEVDDKDTALYNVIDTHVLDTNNPHQVDKADVGLDLVANLAPADMPISDDVQAELDLMYYKADHIDVSAGTGDAGKPIILNASGQIDSSMLDVSSFYYVGDFTPTGAQEYPDTTGESHGAFWTVQGLGAGVEYTFVAGDLAGRKVTDGDFMVWGSAGWSIMRSDMNPSLYYKLDGTQPLTHPFQAGGQPLKAIADGSDPQDAVSKAQLDLKADITYVDSALALKADITYVDSENAAQDLIIAGKEDSLGLGNPGQVLATDAAGTGKEWIDMSGGGGVPEAPNDGVIYGRGGDGTNPVEWVGVLPLTGGTLSDELIVEVYDDFYPAITARATSGSSNQYSYLAPSKLYFESTDGSFNIDSTLTSYIKFELNDTAVIILKDSEAPITDFAPTDVSHLTRKDYVDTGIASRPGKNTTGTTSVVDNLWAGTEQEYQNLGTYEATTTYFII